VVGHRCGCVRGLVVLPPSGGAVDEGLNVAWHSQRRAWPLPERNRPGWLVSQAWRRPSAVYPTGVVCGLRTVAVGMILRQVTHDGVAGKF